jgi:cell division protein FtsW (lipid II flippase)
VISLHPNAETPKHQFQSRLIILAVVAVFLGSVILTLAPAVRLHSWNVAYRWEHWVGFFVWLIGFSILYNQANRFLPDRDPYILPIIALFTGWGLLTIFRLTTNFGFRQTIWLAVSLAGCIVGFRFHNLLTTLRRYKYVWLTCGILLTLLTFVIGTYPGGSGPALWLGFGSVFLQPSELLKLLLIIYLSAYLADSLPARFNLLQLLTPTLILVGVALLILVAQKDLGTASLFIALYTIVIYLASGKRRILLISFILVLIALTAGYLIFDVIQLRVEAWMNPWSDSRDRSYQIVQSLIAIANGGILGRGLGLGSPGVVPVAHSDFIFPAIVEETGFAGSMTLVSLFAFLTLRGISISLHAPNQFQRFLSAGLTTYIATQSILIMGGTIRLLPLTGVTLPFLSYGGTSLVVSFAAAFLLMIISNQAENQPASIKRVKPYQMIGAVFLASFTIIILFTFWWGVIRSENLLDRIDNPRKTISDRYVSRGSILDRNYIPIAENTGVAGEYKRILNFPELSAIIGYSNANYGQTGIEAAMDSTLRGVSGNTFFNVASTRLLYGQFPAGFDLRLSIDLPLQNVVDQSIKDYTGAAVLLNADSGEILVMATSPTFDSNSLEENWATWMDDQTAPLLNRATQALYPPGSATGGIILARFLSQYSLSASIPNLDWTTEPGNLGFCAISPKSDTTWGTLINSGCIHALSTLSRSWSIADTTELYNEAGLYSEPDLPLETSQPVIPNNITSYSELYSGKADLLVSPLQMAVMAASLANGGTQVSPEIASAYKNPEGNWVLFDKKSVPPVLVNFDAINAVSILTQGNFPGWEISSLAANKEASIAWYIAGTPPDWHGTPLALVIALENGTPAEAQTIGREIFLAAISPAE